MKKYLIAAVLLMAIKFAVGAVLVYEFTTSVGATTVTTKCTTRSEDLCDPRPIESPTFGNTRRPAGKGAIEPEKWVLLVLGVCAAGWVLIRSERRHTRQATGIHLLARARRGLLAETVIGFRTF
jgi:hypothetical protein